MLISFKDTFLKKYYFKNVSIFYELCIHSVLYCLTIENKTVAATFCYFHLTNAIPVVNKIHYSLDLKRRKSLHDFLTVCRLTKRGTSELRVTIIDMPRMNKHVIRLCKHGAASVSWSTRTRKRGPAK